MHLPLRAAEIGVGLASERACGAVAGAAGEAADEAVAEAEAVFEVVFDAGAVTQPAFWVFELAEAAALMVLEGLGVVQRLLI